MSQSFVSVMREKCRIFISPYKLKTECGGPGRVGALMAFAFKGGLLGYSDFMPLPVFGEGSLSHELARIQQSHSCGQSFLIAKYNAFLDAAARERGQSLFFGLKIPLSHFLIEDLLSFKTPNRILEEGFQIVKVKLKPRELDRQARRLKSLFYFLKGDIKWRFDLNGAPWAPWRHKLRFLNQNLDFIEDPLPDKATSSESHLFAQDGIVIPGARIRVIKASRDRYDLLTKTADFSFWKRWIFTHSLNHPLGQAISAFWAGRFYKNHKRFFETGGFIPPFSLKSAGPYTLNHKGPVFMPPQGFGWGFSQALKKEKWKRLGVRARVYTHHT